MLREHAGHNTTHPIVGSDIILHLSAFLSELDRVASSLAANEDTESDGSLLGFRNVELDDKSGVVLCMGDDQTQDQSR